MGIAELFFIAIGLSMDAFAVSVCKGLGMSKFNLKHGVVIGLFFGGFQALMPFIGYFAGIGFQRYIENADHWIAFALLTFIGGQMLYEAFKEEEQPEREGDVLKIRQLLMLAIATSIDALIVGITFALLPGTNIWTSITLIGCTTFVLSVAGVAIGFRFGGRYEKKAQIAGGMILILLGIKILLEHLGIL